MWNKFNTGFSSAVIILVFSIAVIFSSNTADAQSLWKQNATGPGSGGTGSVPPDNSSSDKTGIFILAGAAVAAFVLYKLVFEDNSETTAPSDSSDTSSSLLLPSHSNLVMKNSEVIKNQDTPPVNVFIGIRRDNYNTAKEEKTYLVGLSFNF